MALPLTIFFLFSLADILAHILLNRMQTFYKRLIRDLIIFSFQFLVNEKSLETFDSENLYIYLTVKNI